MSRTRRFFGGVTFGYLYQAVVALVGLWLVPFYLDTLGQNDYGLWSITAQILGYLALADLGVVALLPRETAYATGRAGGHRSPADLPEIVGRTARLVLWQTPVVAAVSLGVWLLLPAEWETLRWPLAWLLGAFVLAFPLRVLPAVLQGLQDLAFASLAQTLAWLVGTALGVVLVWRGFGLYALAAGWTATQLTLAALAGWRLARRFPGALPAGLPRLSRGGARRRLAQSSWVSVSQVSQILLNGTDLLILGKLLGAAAVVPYVCTSKLILMLGNQSQLLMHAATPGLSEIKTSESKERILTVVISVSQGMLLVSGGILTLVVAVNGAFVSWWVGPEQYGGLALTALLAVNTLLRHWSLTLAYALFCFGYERPLALIGIGDGVVSVAGAAVLVGLLGPVGAPIGLASGAALVTLPACLYLLVREVKSGLVAIMRPLLPWFWRFCLCAAAAVAASQAWRPDNPLSIALTGALVGTLYAALMLPLLLRPPLRAYAEPLVRPLWLRIRSVLSPVGPS